MTGGASASVLISASAGPRLRAAGEALLRALEADEEMLLLAPSQGAADDLLRGLAASGRGLLGVHAHSFRIWTRQAAALDLAATGLQPVTTLGSEAIAARAARLAKAASELVRLAPVAGMPGFAPSLASTIRELRAAGVPAAALIERPETHDLGRLLERFETEMERFGLADEAAVNRLAAAAVAEGRAFLPTRSVWLDLPLQSAGEADVLRAVAAASREVTATVAAGDVETRRRLESVLGPGAVRVLAPQAPAPRRLGRAQSLLFATGAASSEPSRQVGRPESEAMPAEAEPAGEALPDLPTPGPPSLDLFSAAGEGQECVEIARRIRKSAASGLAFDRIAILLRQPAAYLPLVEDALDRAGIPAWVTRGSLRPNPAGRAFLALLACAGEGLSASRFAEYLSLGQTPETTAEGAPPKDGVVPWVEDGQRQLVLKSSATSAGDGAPPPEARPAVGPATATADEAGVEADGESSPDAAPEQAAPPGSLRVPSLWERLLVDAAVVGGADRWKRRLEGLHQEFLLQIREANEEDERRRRYLERQIDRLGTLRSFALPLVSFLDDLPERADWGVWLDRLGRLAAMALRRPESVLGVLAELRPLSDVSEVGLSEVERVLAERLRFSRREPPKRRYGRVFVGAVEEAAGRSFELVFVPGLAEGVFPRRSGEDPLLLDDLRRALNEDGHGLAVSADRTSREQFLLRLAVGASERWLDASYPRVDLVQGRARVPSLYALDLLRAAEGELPDLETLGRRAAAGGAAMVGWPAPARPEEAIDEAEFDLALLQPLLGGGASPAKQQGRARFLLSANEHLDRALRSRAMRWRKTWFPADGLVHASEEAREILSNHRISARSYSPTALQNFASCPYRFFLQAVLYLRPRDTIVRLEQLDALTRGSVFHEIQFRLFGALGEADLLPVVPARLEAAFEVLDAVLEVAERDFHDQLAPPIERVWKAEFESLRGDLRGWLRQVADEPGGFVPVHAELGFGLRRSRDRDPKSVRDAARVLDGARLRGSIDLVEADPSGRLRVTDHKTGRARKQQGDLVIGGGKVLQPVLYALSAEAVLGREVRSGRLSYCTQRGGYSEVSVPLDDRSRDAARRMLAIVDQALDAGFLPAAPDEGACGWCDYRPVCGPYEELRVHDKKKGPLQPLAKLRGMR